MVESQPWQREGRAILPQKLQNFIFSLGSKNSIVPRLDQIYIDLTC